MNQVTKNVVSAMRHAAYENLKSNFTKDEWESFFAKERNKIFLVKVYDNKKAIYCFFRNKELYDFLNKKAIYYDISSRESKMNSNILKDMALSPDGELEFIGVVDRQTKTFTPMGTKIIINDGMLKWGL